MIKKYGYNTVTEAVALLRKDGFTADFQFNGNYIIGSNGKRFAAKDLRKLFVYRYEGPSDPADEATVYGLKTNEGTKGVLVIGDGIYADGAATAMLVKLHQSGNEERQRA